MDTDLDNFTLDGLVAYNQRLAREQDAMRARRLAVADEIRARIAAARQPHPSPGDGAATGALPTISLSAPE